MPPRPLSDRRLKRRIEEEGVEHMDNRTRYRELFMRMIAVHERNRIKAEAVVDETQQDRQQGRRDMAGVESVDHEGDADEAESSD